MQIRPLRAASKLLGLAPDGAGATRFKETFMRSTIMSFVLLAGLISVACDQQVQQTGMSAETVSAASEIYLPEGDANAGRQVFLDFRCNTCHSIPSEGVERRVEGEIGPELGKAQAAQPREQVASSIIAPSHAFAENGEKWKSGELSRMGSFNEHLTVRQWMDLVAYVKSLDK
jgi:cytochrome c2